MNEPFALEPPSALGMPSAATIEELRRLYRYMAVAAGDYNEAIKVQAEKHTIKAGALKRYVSALERDKTDEALSEAKDLENLIGDI